MKLKYLCKQWLSTRTDLKIGTVECYSNVIKYIADDVDVDLLQCQNLLNKLISGGFAASTVKHLKVVITQAVKYGYMRGLCDYMPCNMLSVRGAKPPREVSAFSAFEIQPLAAELNKSRFALAYRLLLETGIRSGELLALRWIDVDYALGAIYITKTNYRGKIQPAKTNKSNRTIPLTRDTLKLLAERHRHARLPDMFPFTYYQLRDDFRRCCAAAGVTCGGLHRLRHTFATAALRAGVDIKTVSAMLGHSTTNITMDVYMDVSLADKRAALDRIPSLFGFAEERPVTFQRVL